VTTRRDTAQRALALASIGAGVIHIALGPEHMSEWVVLGTGFYAAGVLQLLFGLVLLRRGGRALLAAGVLGSLAFIGVWLVSRTTGLPVGPQAGVPEGYGVADMICVGLESVVAIGALTLLRRPAAGTAPAGRGTARTVLAAVAVAVFASTGVAVAAPAHQHGAACPTAAVTTGVDANHNGADDGVENYFACQLLHEHDDHKGYVPPKL
jgi:hypothetical protein